MKTDIDNNIKIDKNIKKDKNIKMDKNICRKHTGRFTGISQNRWGWSGRKNR